LLFVPSFWDQAGPPLSYLLGGILSVVPIGASSLLPQSPNSVPSSLVSVPHLEIFQRSKSESKSKFSPEDPLLPVNFSKSHTLVSLFCFTLRCRFFALVFGVAFSCRFLVLLFCVVVLVPFFSQVPPTRETPKFL
jgi:hypothetical protein